MNDQQIGNLRMRDGGIQIKVNGRWRPIHRMASEIVLWTALLEMDARVKRLEHEIDRLRGHDL